MSVKSENVKTITISFNLSRPVHKDLLTWFDEWKNMEDLSTTAAIRKMMDAYRIADNKKREAIKK